MVNSYNRRGISTIVGGIIFLVLLTSGFSSFYIALDVQKDTINTQREISKDIVEKTLEQFVISAGTNPVDNKLGIQVKNQGPNPVEITNIWIINNSLPNSANSYDIDYEDAFIPPGFGAAILENIPPLYLASNDYTIKVVSSLGSIKQTDLTVGGPNNLLAELFTIPPDVRQGENVTIALRITNVGDTPLVDVEPHYIPPVVNLLSEIDSSSFISPSPVTLEPAESTIFTWHYKLKTDATVGNKVNFTSAANGTDSATGFDILSNNATDWIIIRDPQGGSGETIVISEDLVSKPGIYVISPGPFGGDSSNTKGLWGVNVANPTELIMNVSKVVFTATDPEGGGGLDLFESSKCDIENISPWGVGGPGDWLCSLDNQVRWKNTASPIQIPPKSVYSFLAKIENPGSGGAKFLESVPIQATVVTSSGTFGKSGYDATSDNQPDVTVNVYLGNNDPLPDPRQNSNLNSTRTGIIGNSIETFNIWLADFGSDPDERIKGLLPDGKTSTLIINVPRDWEVQLPLPPSNDVDWVMKYTPFPGGSSQIIGTLKNDLTSGAKKITFDAKAPDKPDKKMYIMHVLGNGVTDNNWTVSPLTEIVLQVCPSSTGC